LRGALEKNGVRVGVLGQQLPARLRELIDKPTEFTGRAQSGVSPTSSTSMAADSTCRCVPAIAHRQSVEGVSIAARAAQRGGKQSAAISSPMLGCTLSLKAHPQGDGRVRLNVTPKSSMAR